VDEVTETEGGSATVRMRYADTGWMVRLVLGLGPDATVREPPELATMVAERARAAVQRSDHLPSILPS
jgi:proteasome accessory factor C